MEIIEYEPNQAMGMITRDGPIEIRSTATFESVGTRLTKLTLTVDIPGLNDSMETPMTDAIKGSLRKMKELIEADN